MCLWTIVLLVVGTILSAVATALAAEDASPGETARFTPARIDDVLANPHMGWQTFMQTADQDANLPAWIPSTVAYFRWGWREIEPVPGELNTPFIDQVLERATAAGQTVAFRVMAVSSEPDEPYHPDWIARIPDGLLQTTYDTGPTLTVPDLDHPEVLRAHLELIRRLGGRYDGDPRLEHVDLGSVGWWGEWHMSGGGPVGMPSDASCRKVIDAYFEAFRKTPLVMLIGGEKHTAYAVSRGAGWRADCLGDMGGFSKSWCHMRQGYPTWFDANGLGNVWKTAPVAYETCWEMRHWVKQGWDVGYIFDYAIATNASFVNNKSAALPEGEGIRRQIERLLKRLGYRIVLEEAIATVDRPFLRITSTWRNIGSAPCLRPYRVAWRLKGETTHVVESETGISGWLSGHIEPFTPAFLEQPPELPEGPANRVEHALPLATITPGQYALQVAIVDAGHAPAIRLGIAGRQDDGWYDLGQVTIPPRP